MRPQTEFCFVKNCKVQIFNEWGRPATGVGSLYIVRLERSFCRKHGELWMEVDHDLPLAIQELHALALLFPQSPRGLSEMIVKPDPDMHDLDAPPELRAAYARVARLRALEAELKGD